MQPDWMEHSMSIVTAAVVIIGVLLSTIGTLLIRAMNNNSATIKDFRGDIRKLFDRIEKTENAVAYLKGQHEARTGMRLSCSAEVQK